MKIRKTINSINPFHKTFGQKVKARIAERLVEETASAVFVVTGGVIAGVLAGAQTAIEHKARKQSS